MVREEQGKIAIIQGREDSGLNQGVGRRNTEKELDTKYISNVELTDWTVSIRKQRL